MMAKAVLLSVKPRYAHEILSGRKTVEVRRRFPIIPSGTTVVIYSTSPERAIIGTVLVKRSTRVDPSEVWKLHSNDICIEQDDLIKYLDGASESTLLEVESPRRLDKSVPLNSFRSAIRVEPPQSFRYLQPAQVALVEDLGKSAAPSR